MLENMYDYFGILTSLSPHARFVAFKIETTTRCRFPSGKVHCFMPPCSRSSLQLSHRLTTHNMSIRLLALKVPSLG